MWAEARKQEKKIRGIMVDYKKRAERRREYYEKIRQDPTQFLRLHGRACKINLDPSVAEAAESPATMMPWQGDSSNMIDRFDVRAHLDIIPTINPIKPKRTPEEEKDDRRLSEEQCLKQIEIDETFPLHSKSRENQKPEVKKAAIGFTYEDSTHHQTETKKDKWEEDSNDSDTSLSDIDLDVEIDISELTDENKKEVNLLGDKFGMGKTHMVRSLEREREEAEDFKRAKEEEAEKALYSGRKSRRERRALIEKRLRERRGEQMSPPSYAQRGSPDYSAYKKRSSSSSSRSRSRSPVDSGKVTFITSFGGEENRTAAKSPAAPTEGNGKSSPATPPNSSSSKTRVRSSSVSSASSSSSGSHSPEIPVKPPRSPNTSRSSSSSSTRSPVREKTKTKAKTRTRSKSRSRSRSPARSRSRRSRSRSRSHSKYDYKSTRRQRSRSRDRGRRSRSRSPLRRARSRTRSRSRDRKLTSRYDTPSSKLKKKEPPKTSAISAVKGNAGLKTLTPQEKMKLRMQKALNKQHKADKIKEIRKKVEKHQAEQDREEEMQERKWRMRQREREKQEQAEEKRRRQISSGSSSRENTPEKYSKRGDPPPRPRRYSRSSSRSMSRSPSPSRSHRH